MARPRSQVPLIGVPRGRATPRQRPGAPLDEHELWLLATSVIAAQTIEGCPVRAREVLQHMSPERVGLLPLATCTSRALGLLLSRATDIPISGGLVIRSHLSQGHRLYRVPRRLWRTEAA